MHEHLQDSKGPSKDPINDTLDGLAAAAAEVSSAQARGPIEKTVIKVLTLRVAKVGIRVKGLGRRASVMKFCGIWNGGVRVILRKGGFGVEVSLLMSLQELPA